MIGKRKKEFRSQRKHDPDRFYLFPGQGGRAYRRKQLVMLAWALFLALLIAGIIAGIIYWINRPPQF